MVLHRIKNLKVKDSKMVLIAQPLLKSRIGAYLESLANEVIMTAKKLGCKDELLVMLFANKKKTTNPYRLSYSLESGNYSH